MSGKRVEVSTKAKERLLIMQDRASAVLSHDTGVPADKQYRVYLFMMYFGKKSVWDTKQATAEEAINEAWKYYIARSELGGAEWIRGEVLP